MKKKYAYYLFIFVGLLLIVFLYYKLFSNNNSEKPKKLYLPMEYKKDFTNNIKNVTLSTVDSKRETLDTNKTKTHKEVFKEPQDMPLDEKLEDEHDITNIDKESQKIIKETDMFIKEKGIEVIPPKLSPQQEKELQKYDNDLNKLKNKVEELSHEE